MMRLELTINGDPITISVPSGKRLLDILREDLDLKGTKEGCGQGECGACTIVLNGDAVNSCLILACQLRDGDNIWTIEGKNSLLVTIKQKMVDYGSVQCGFCTPGIVMSTFALFSKNQQPRDSEIKVTLSGNLCRCTGYTKILEAMKDVRKTIKEAP